MERSDIKLAIVLPCYNESEALNNSLKKLIAVLRLLIDESLVSQQSILYLVDDGSVDSTWNIIESANKEYDGQVKGLKLTRNFGNQNAILAGIRESQKLGVNCIVTIDADLQQDETKIKDFILKYKDGYDIVFGVRNDRKTDNFFKKTTSLMFYKFMEQMGVNLVPNHSEYRLMGKRALETLALYHEKNIFIRGIFSNMGLKSAEVNFDVKKREYGKSKFNFISLLRLASWGITSFSVRPLRLIFYMGLIIAFVSFLLGLVCLWNLYMPQYRLLDNFTIELYEVFETFASGLEILAIGIIGEYIAQILQEIKSRPNYLIDKKID